VWKEIEGMELLNTLGDSMFEVHMIPYRLERFKYGEEGGKL